MKLPYEKPYSLLLQYAPVDIITLSDVSSGEVDDSKPDIDWPDL